ncbi:MAG: Spy/CpxP family protein refolding chaperone [Burkholderiaceae bacterium]|nr:Spy/CpxP family protein refolding chaperone [Burkholderiaceae bacterium]
MIAATGTLALAQSGPAPAASAPAAKQHRHTNPAVMQQRMAARHEKHMTNLKTLLKLTSEQETAWTNFTAAMQPPGPQARENRAEAEQLTTPERIDLMQNRAAERQARMQQRGDAVKAFYAQLTPEQQKTFDQHTQKKHDRQGPRHGQH